MSRVPLGARKTWSTTAMEATGPSTAHAVLVTPVQSAGITSGHRGGAGGGRSVPATGDRPMNVVDGVHLA